MTSTNPIELEIFRHLLSSVAEEMGVVLMRSAYSPNIKERRDHSCAVFDGQGNMLAQAAHIPVHLGSTPMSVAAAITALGSEIAEGEMVVLNDPYQGGTHLPDITVVAPVFIDETIAFWVANRAHHADIGGITPGSLPLSRHIDDEGFVIAPTRLTDEFTRVIAHASRTPDERLGDLLAQRAAATVGIRRLTALCDRYGHSVVSARGDALLDHGERVMRAIMADIPNGSYEFVDYLDDDGLGTTDIAIRLTLVIDGEQATLDFRESADQVPGPLNAVRAITVSAVSYVFSCLGRADERVTNAGSTRAIEVLTRPGSVVDARSPAPVAAGNVETSQRIVDVVLGALAQALPGRIPAASCGSMNNVTIGGCDPRRAGAPFAYYETIAGGSGAGPGWHGASAVHTHMTNTLNTPVEALEHAYPFRVVCYAIRDGSGGNGRYRGGDGVVRTYEMGAEVELTMIGERRTRGAYGLAGGEPGAAGVTTLRRADGTCETWPGKRSAHLGVGDRIEIATPGGGGFGHVPEGVVPDEGV